MVSQNKFKLHATTPYWQLQIGLIHNGDLVIEPMVTAKHRQRKIVSCMKCDLGIRGGFQILWNLELK